MLNVGRVKKIMVAVLGVDVEAINDDSSSDDIASWDSLRHINLIVALEQEFDISFLDEEVASLTSVRLLNLAITDALARAECS